MYLLVTKGPILRICIFIRHTTNFEKEYSRILENHLRSKDKATFFSDPLPRNPRGVRYLAAQCCGFYFPSKERVALQKIR